MGNSEVNELVKRVEKLKEKQSTEEIIFHYDVFLNLISLQLNQPFYGIFNKKSKAEPPEKYGNKSKILSYRRYLFQGGKLDGTDPFLRLSFWNFDNLSPVHAPYISFGFRIKNSLNKFKIKFKENKKKLKEEYESIYNKKNQKIEFLYDADKKWYTSKELFNISELKNQIELINSIIEKEKDISKVSDFSIIKERIKFIESLSPENNNKEKEETEEEKMEKIKNKTYDVNEDGNLNGISYPEGTEKIAKHKRFERNSKLISDAKKYFKYNNNGQLFCEVCGFNFKETYSLNSDENRLEEYIEAHHKIPLSEIKNTTKSTISDLAMLCANCHRMIHFSGGKGCIDYNDFKKKFGKEK